jgi:tetratricopeptide (TPR) repeat protein
MSARRFTLCTVAFFLVEGLLATAHAETCPEVPDDEVALRRSVAKEFFAKAEEAEAAGDKQAAIRRYACSLGLAPHPSTAYNLGTVAEKSGDLSMALDGFRTYLKLAPEATDRPAIEARIMALEAKISELRKDIAAKPATDAAATPATTTGAAPPTAPGAATRPTAPAAGAANRGAADAGARSRHVAGWIMGTGAVAALGTGVVLNLVARSKMNTCSTQWAATMAGSALDYCDQAKPFAYTSYALFGVAGVAGAVSALLFFSQPDTTPPDDTATAPELGLVPTNGGAALVASGRF